jgi:hypothetical protein
VNVTKGGLVLFQRSLIAHRQPLRRLKQLPCQCFRIVREDPGFREIARKWPVSQSFLNPAKAMPIKIVDSRCVNKQDTVQNG